MEILVLSRDFRHNFFLQKDKFRIDKKESVREINIIFQDFKTSYIRVARTCVRSQV